MASIAQITQEYFMNNSEFVEMLDSDNIVKQSSRCYFVVVIKYNNNSFFIPLRKHIDLRLGNIGYSIPSSTRPSAGLDYRKALIVNDESFVAELSHPNISSSQMNKLTSDVVPIEAQFIRYVEGYVKSSLKKREKLDRLYKYSTLHNFHKELGVM